MTKQLFSSLILFLSLLGGSMMSTAELAKATFAGGCFWCMEKPFDRIGGVQSVTVGYTAGHQDNPTYEQVSAGGTGHTEAIQVEYDSNEVTYRQLLDVFWVNIDPTDAKGQFCDKGSQYRSGIYYHNQEQQKLAEASKQALIDSKKVSSVETEIVAATTFYPAEAYHQHYYKKNPLRYNFYRFACGRDKRLNELWGE